MAVCLCVCSHRCCVSQIVYEQRIASLEEEMAKSSKPPSGTSRHSTVSALEKELEAAKEQHRRRLNEQQDVIVELRNEIETLKRKDSGKSKRAIERGGVQYNR